ncbi:MAG: ATP-dependent endonuclease, partial [Blastopirellula sp. JB062]
MIVVEGTNDVEFLQRISRICHRHDASLPDLMAGEERGEIIFLPFGGGHVSAWTHRLEAFGLPEFHLYDHELPPETDYRRQAVETIQRRPHCWAALTKKRSLENYLHPEAIRMSSGVEIEVDDFSRVAETAAKRLYQTQQ